MRFMSKATARFNSISIALQPPPTRAFSGIAPFTQATATAASRTSRASDSRARISGTIPTIASKGPIKLAILDDYASIASHHFEPLKTANPNLEIHSFPTTLNAKIEAEHAELISRLEPFTIISSMRERTQFPRSVLSQLPNLKLL